MSIINLTPKQLRRAASIKETIEELQNELNKLGGGSTTPAETAKPRRKMSKAARAKIGAAVRARWAKVRGEKSMKPAPKKKTKMSAAGRANIIAAQKARWAKIKAAKPADKKFKAVKPAKKKFRMSAAAKAKLSAAAKARWRKAKAAGKKRL